MKLMFEPTEDLTAKELWEILNLFEIKTLVVHADSVPDYLRKHFTETYESVYQKMVNKN